jgi:hypothetical protein
MSHTLVLTMLHPCNPLLREWRLLADGIQSPATPVVTALLPRAIYKYVKDPHVENTVYGDLLLTAVAKGQLRIIERLLAGEKLLFNKKGGFIPYDPKMEVSRREVADLRDWPTDEGTPLRVTISRWPAGTHWYATPDNPTLEPTKHTTVEAAKRYAARAYPGADITIKS